ncbi:MAG: BrnA antitoxin family protein [Hydrogenovibrio sp.]|uniref:BrnA antitoxin family protein n=1 Tax=Hydrogenovibrio sp. TaxID=2065821 RepID=UPI0028701457|nr:BrnA antitoxin family protein [Hydrogenovibrio sp.]MDR9499741.1 BrnA antitoxin family protein [Hydrogenovibrio sp.]
MNEQDSDNAFDEVPELEDDFFQRAELKDGGRVIRPGRPKLATPKERVTIRFDADVVAYSNRPAKASRPA